MVTVLVDAANTVGSRPDGWWRDRAGATARLLAGLAALPGTALRGDDGAPVRVDAVVAVVEGAARDVPSPGGLGVVRAPGSGDDALVLEAERLLARGADVLVVTADRELRARLPAAVAVTGPRRLLAALPG